MRQVIVATALAVLTVVVPQAARGECIGTPLTGLDPSGASDNTTAIQNAIDNAAQKGGGSVVFPVGRYRVDSPLTVETGVVLCGATQGPFDVVGIDPAIKTVAATLLVKGTPANQAGTPFLTLKGVGAGVSDILFHYPDQYLPDAAVEPAPYPWTVWMGSAGTKIERCTVTNAYQFLRIAAGRTIAANLFIGAFWCGVFIDDAADHVTVTNTIQSVFWDIYTSSVYTQTLLSTWAMNNGYGFIIKRVDSVVIHNALVLWRYAGFYLSQSDNETPPRSGWGFATDIMIDRVQYGIIARSSDTAGYKFANIDIVPSHLGKSAVAYASPAPGAAEPSVLVNGGAIRGVWALDKFQRFPPGAQLVVVNVLGHNYLP